jgi:hypothetical protein
MPRIGLPSLESGSDVVHPAKLDTLQLQQSILRERGAICVAVGVEERRPLESEEAATVSVCAEASGKPWRCDEW